MEDVFDAINRLTYSEMIEMCMKLRDVAQACGMDVDDVYDWAKTISSTAKLEDAPRDDT
jgi:hypothetical protein